MSKSKTKTNELQAVDKEEVFKLTIEGQRELLKLNELLSTAEDPDEASRIREEIQKRCDMQDRMEKI